jgi:hypothetical protein
MSDEWPTEPFHRELESGVRLYDGPIHLQSIGTSVQVIGDGHVAYDWHRGLHVDLEEPVSGPVTVGPVARLTLPDLGANAEVIRTLESYSFDGETESLRFEGALGESLLWRREAATEVRFDIAGLVQTVMLQSSGSHWQGDTRRMLLEADRWRLLIWELADAQQRRDKAKRTGCGAVTHTASLRSTDGSLINPGEVEELLHALTWLLSFASSAWVAAIAPTGLNASGEAAWARWGQPRWSRAAGWRWLGAHHPEAIPAIWPRWWQLWQSRPTRDVLRWAVPSYVESALGRAGLEVSIPAAFTSLEILAWHNATARQNLSNKQAKDLSAKGRLQMLLNDCSVPLNIPPQLPAAHEWASRAQDDAIATLNGAAVVANVRNRIEHPRDTKRVEEVPVRARHELLQLMLWWIEMVLLRTCGYDGEYLDRTNPNVRLVTETTRPPWVT